MVDAIVSFTVERLSDFLIQKANFIQGIRHDVEWLRNTLDYMRCLLKDAEERQDEDHRLRKWLSDVLDVAYYADDVIDDFFIKIKVGGTQTEGEPLRKTGFKAFLNKSFCICKKEAYTHKQVNLCKIGKKIEKLKTRLTEIDENRKRFQIRNIGDAREGSSHTNETWQLRRTSPYADDDDYIVGFEQDAESLKAELLRDEPRRCVISILGMGGLGKTTLAQKIYNNSTIKYQFHCHAWVSVSKEYSTKDLLQRIMKWFKPPSNKEELEILDKMTIEDLERELRKYLEGLRYLVVIDDVWKKEAWQSLKRAFPDNKNASRVIITTRNKDVAERSDERTHVYELPFLTEEESWKLFCKKAFLNGNVAGDQATHPPSLEKLAKDMVRRCNGLPLAIVVLGGLMSRKPYDEWAKVKDRLWRDIQDESIHVKHVLDLSYNDLRCELKLCFLYLGLFPEDFEIDVEKILHMWVAEGFIQPSQETSEELAAEYLSELIDRNLIQVQDRNWRRIYSFRVHDLVRDLAIQKAKELKFLQVYDIMMRHSSTSINSLRFRRLVSHSGFTAFASSNHSFSRLHTLFCFGVEGDWTRMGDAKLLPITNFKLLRVLDFTGFKFEGGRLSDAIGDLIHLKYLGLRLTNVSRIPPSIGNLLALQTLDAFSFDTSLHLPDKIGDLKQLRHLYGCRISWHFPINNLTSLQTLASVVVDGQMEFDLESLIDLGELRLFCRGSGFTLDCISKLRNLRNLELDFEGFNCSTLQPLSHCKNLCQLRLIGYIEKLPMEMHEFLPNLKYLYMWVNEREKKEDPMAALEKLPNLTVLAIGGHYERKEWACTAGGFPLLQSLEIFRCDAEELQVDEGAMPLLRCFRFIFCDFTIPERIRSLPAPKYRFRLEMDINVWAY